MSKLRVGIVGLGNVAEIHLEAYKEIKEIDIIAGSDINPQKVKEMSEKWTFKGYNDHTQMLENENLDIVCVLVPPRYHKDVIEDIAKAKVNILCEKPLASNLDDANKIVEICENNSIKFYYGATYRWLSACRKARELIKQGSIGKVSLLLETFIGGRGIEGYKDLGANHYPKGGPGGGGMGLIDHGIHLIDIFSWIMDSKVEYVVGRGNFSGKSPKTEFLTIMFENGTVGQLLYNEATYSANLPYEGIFSWGGSWDIQGNLSLEGSWEEYPGNIRIYGEKGALRVFYYANKLFFFTKDKKQPIRVLDRPMPGNFALQMESFINSLKNDSELESTVYDGLNALKIALAAYKSFDTKQFVRIEY
ncbi:MAG: hypothetical protein GF317_21835 [Candidatus Lokiarchaeota archaeon]|nr:hypothetical protein [Candidatus Lokiarchaeota archaeon]MBD3202103.1 hypothetical protein [Candidatus Lokiarchaeota archaeon]